MKVVTGPDLSTDLVTTTAASRSFSVNPTIAGIFEVRERREREMMIRVSVLGGPDNSLSSSS